MKQEEGESPPRGEGQEKARLCSLYAPPFSNPVCSERAEGLRHSVQQGSKRGILSRAVTSMVQQPLSPSLLCLLLEQHEAIVSHLNTHACKLIMSLVLRGGVFLKALAPGTK